MVDLILAIALFVLTVAIVGLFAMMGELASRVPDDGADEAAAPPSPIQQVVLDVVPDRWIDGLAYLREREFGVAVVFSTSCTGCQRIASGATGKLDLPPDAAVVVSSPSRELGERFVDDNPALGRYRSVIDEGGTWLTENLGVDISPSILTFHFGRLTSAHTFASASVLARHFDSLRPRVEEKSPA
jgi:hypothetical protein